MTMEDRRFSAGQTTHETQGSLRPSGRRAPEPGRKGAKRSTRPGEGAAQLTIQRAQRGDSDSAHGKVLRTVNNAALTLTESFRLSTGKWKTLAPMPQGTMGLGRSVAHKGQFYSFGGENSNNGNVVGTVEIYQP
jgi:hypothetical protein